MKVITSYLTKYKDEQRGVNWESNENLIYPLAYSCEKRGVELIVLNDCFEDGIRNGATFIKIDTNCNPYFDRWRIQSEYLKTIEDENVFLVDSTDVIMQYDPFYSIEKGKIYVGDEFEVIGSDWMLKNSNGKVKEFIENNMDIILLNCGVLGGSREDIINISEDILKIYQKELDIVEMPIFNYVLRTKYNDRLVRGRNITSIFKAYESNSHAFFKHK